MIGLWLALDTATTDNGCLRFIPGSHHRELTIEATREQIETPALAGRLAEDIVPAEPGDAILIDGLVFHASEPNRSTLQRWAYSAFCVACDAVFAGTEAERQHFLLLRGERIPGRI